MDIDAVFSIVGTCLRAHIKVAYVCGGIQLEIKYSVTADHRWGVRKAGRYQNPIPTAWYNCCFYTRTIYKSVRDGKDDPRWSVLELRNCETILSGEVSAHGENIV